MTNLAAALVKAQAEFPPIPKDGAGNFGKHATLHTIAEKTLPVLNSNGLALLQFPTIADGQPALRTKLVHAESGECEEDTMLLILDKNNSQGQGSALSYGRRYAWLAILGLVADEDDDGAAASRPKVSQKKNKPVAKTDDAEALHSTLAEIGAIVTALAEAKGNDKADWIKSIDEGSGDSWRTNVVAAALVLAKVRRWAEQAHVGVAK